MSPRNAPQEKSSLYVIKIRLLKTLCVSLIT